MNDERSLTTDYSCIFLYQQHHFQTRGTFLSSDTKRPHNSHRGQTQNKKGLSIYSALRAFRKNQNWNRFLSFSLPTSMVRTAHSLIHFLLPFSFPFEGGEKAGRYTHHGTAFFLQTLCEGDGWFKLSSDGKWAPIFLRAGWYWAFLSTSFLSACWEATKLYLAGYSLCWKLSRRGRGEHRLRLRLSAEGEPGELDELLVELSCGDATALC